MVSTDLFIKSNLSCCVEFIFFCTHFFMSYHHLFVFSESIWTQCSFSYPHTSFDYSILQFIVLCFISSWLVSICTFFLVPLRVCTSERKRASSHSACLVFNFLPVAWLTPQIINKVVAFSHETAAVADARCFVQTKTNTEIRTNINK